MRPYETMLLVDARREDAQIEETINAFAALVTQRGGEIAGWDRWGRRKLAYEMDDLTEGYYAICNYSLESTLRGEIEAALPFIEGLVRSKTIRRDDRARATGDAAKQQRPAGSEATGDAAKQQRPAGSEATGVGAPAAAAEGTA